MRSEDVQPLRIPTSGSERGPVAPARRTDELDRRIIEALQSNGRESFRAIAGLEEHVGLRRQLRPGARELVVDDLLSCVDAGVELGHRDLHVAVEPAAELVERADVVAVAVGDRDAPDRGACLLGGLDQRVAAARDGRVDEREPVVLAHKKRVHEAQPRELD